MAVEQPVPGRKYRLTLEPGCEHEQYCHGLFPSLNGQVVVYEGKSPNKCHPFKVRLNKLPNYVKATELDEL